jgi:hypothetical protein
MDDRRFDNWARTMAGPGSRRRVLGGLIGIGSAAFLGAFRRGASDASAHHGRSGPGDPCRDDDQCVGADAPLVCAWNGFDYDGDLNCCTYEGNRCGFDEACCGMASCIGGFCSSAGSASAGNGGFARLISIVEVTPATSSAWAILRAVCASVAETCPTRQMSLFPPTAVLPLPMPAAGPATWPGPTLGMATMGTRPTIPPVLAIHASTPANALIHSRFSPAITTRIPMTTAAVAMKVTAAVGTVAAAVG